MKEKKIIAIYLRLSSEDKDEDKDESNSITNQRFLLHSFIRKFPLDEYEVVEYVDDGYTGKNLDRPGMQRMLQDIRDRKVAIVVVKDFSRMARDHIIMGDFIDKIFPFLQIRFISVNDHFDSNDYDGRTPDMDVPFQNLASDYYCEECSIKIKEGIKTVQNQGEYYSSEAPFGYQKDPEIKNHIIPDDETAPIVQRLFHMRGVLKYEKRKIVHILNEEGVTIPSEYANNKAGKLVKNYAGKIRIWTVDMLDRILRNPMYCGKTVAGKSRTIGPATKKVIWIPKEKYIITENTHEALVSQELFDIVQSMEQTRETNGRYKMTDEFRVTPVSGMVRCGICEHKMYRRFYNKKTQKSQYYCYYANMAKDMKCMKGSLDEKILVEVVEKVVMQQIEVVARLQEVQKERNRIEADNRKKADRERKKIRDRINAVKQKNVAAYEKYSSGELSREDFMSYKEANNLKVEKLLEEIGRLEQDIMDAAPEENEFLKLFDGVKWDGKLTRELSEMLIDTIYVYDQKHIEVVFKYQDEYKKLLQTLKNEERKAV